MVLPYSHRVSRVPWYSFNLGYDSISRTGLSPSLVGLSRPFRYTFTILNEVGWADPRSLAATNGISVDFCSYGY
jgi:hypothetical protein